MQTAHSIADFFINYPNEAESWYSCSNYIASLSVEDEESLLRLVEDLQRNKIKYVLVREPDIDNQATAVAIEPSEETRRLCSKLPLALKGIGEGINKHVVT